MERYRQLQERVREWSVRHAQGPFATPFLFALAFTETLFFPLPLETALIPLVLIKARSWVYYAAVATVGAVSGSVLGYIIGYVFYETLGAALVNFYSFEEEVLHIKTLLSSHVFSATFVASFTPLPDKVFMPIAGLLNAPFLLFFVALVAGRGLRCVLVAFITDRYGAYVARVVLKYLFETTLVVVALLAGLFIFWLI